MLSSKYRLKKKINFARIEIDGQLIQSKSFGMGIYDRKDDDPSHFGFIISTKISKKAVIRNRIKRIMSEIIRINLNKLKSGYDVLFLIKHQAVKISREELEKETYEAIIKNIQK
ncbi:MAG: ribonuclease P [uncultured bacterium]|nr:MAG: ribonuclease P [uncultured bacterium]